MDEPGISVAEIEAKETSYPYYSHEMMANSIGQSSFSHPSSKTEAILKTHCTAYGGGVDRVSVTAYSFETIPRVDYVNVLGGDGHIHPVPVHWDEYIPIFDSGVIEVEAANIPWTNDECGSFNSNDIPNGKLFRGFVARQIN